MRFKKVSLMFLIVTTMITLVACGGAGSKSAEETANQKSVKAEQPPNLTGEWKQANSDSKTTYQTAVIKGNTVEVYWVDEDKDSKSLYWSGTYIATAIPYEQFTWESVNDKEKTSKWKLASRDDKKTFSYSGGILSYSVSDKGTTKTEIFFKQ